EPRTPAFHAGSAGSNPAGGIHSFVFGTCRHEVASAPADHASIIDGVDYHRFVRPRLGLAFSRWLDKGRRHPSPRRRAFWRLLAGFVLLLALFGTIVFAVAASGHDP